MDVPLTLTILAEDAFGNAIHGFVPGSAIDLTQSGGTPANIAWGGLAGLTDLGNGAARLAGTVVFDGAGELDFTLVDTALEGPMTVRVTRQGTLETALSDPFTWRPGSLDHFVVDRSAATIALTGSVTITVRAEDRYAHPIPDFAPANPVDLTQAGGAGTSLEYTGPAGLGDNGNGTAVIAAGTAFSAAGELAFTAGNDRPEGPVRFTARHRVGGQSGISAGVTWVQVITSFSVSAAPSDPLVGQATVITITALDVLGGAMPGYQPASDLELNRQGGSPAIRYAAAAGFAGLTDFADGSALIAAGAVFDSAGAYRANATDELPDTGVSFRVTLVPGGETGTGGNVSWRQFLDRYGLTASDDFPTVRDAVTFTLRAEDPFGRAIPNFQAGGALAITQTGATASTLDYGGAVIDGDDGTATIPASTVFDASGRFSFTAADSTPEGPVVFRVTDASAGDTADSPSVTWIQVLSRFLVQEQETTETVGQPISLVVTALDTWDDPIPRYSPATALDLIMSWSGGSATSALALPLEFDDNGRIGVNAVSNAVLSDVTLNITKRTTGETGASGLVEWTAILDRFIVTLSATSAVVGNQVLVTVRAVDDEKDPLVNGYSPDYVLDIKQAGGSAKLTYSAFPGYAAPTPAGSGHATLPATMQFDANGEYLFYISDTRAEGPVNLTVKQRTSGEIGSSPGIVWLPGPPDHFEAAVDGSAPHLDADVTLTVQIQDRYDNPIPGWLPTAALSVTQAGSADPSKLRYTGLSQLTDNGNGSAQISGSVAFDGTGAIQFKVRSSAVDPAVGFTVTHQGQTGSTPPIAWSEGPMVSNASPPSMLDTDSLTVVLDGLHFLEPSGPPKIVTAVFLGDDTTAAFPPGGITPSLIASNRLEVPFPSGLEPGGWEVWVQWSDGTRSLGVVNTVTLDIYPASAPKVGTISPISRAAGQTVLVGGDDFWGAGSVVLRDAGGALPEVVVDDYEVLDNGQVFLTIPTETPAGSWYVVVTGRQGGTNIPTDPGDHTGGPLQVN